MKFKGIIAGVGLGLASLGLMAAPVQASSAHEAQYHNMTFHTLHVYSGGSCNISDHQLTEYDTYWRGFSYKMSFNNYAQVRRLSGHLDPKVYHAAGSCIGYPQLTDPIETITITSA